MSNEELAKLLLKATEQKYQPETVKLVEWKSRVTEALETIIKMHVDDCNALPSVEEYREIARYVLETTTWRRR